MKKKLFRLAKISRDFFDVTSLKFLITGLIMTFSLSLLSQNSFQIRLAEGCLRPPLVTGKVVHNNDGSFFIASGFYTCASAINSIYLARTNALGQTAWAKYYSIGRNVQFNSIKKMDNGGCVMVGGFLDSLNVQRGFLLSVNKDGNILLLKSILYRSYAIAQDVVSMSDGGFAITGSPFGVLRLDAQGQVLWYKNLYPLFSSIVATKDNAFIFAGTTSAQGAGKQDMVIAKIDVAGQLLWSKIIGTPVDETGIGLVSTAENGAFLLGYYRDFAYYSALLLKLDGNGNLKWSKSILTGGANAGNAMAVFANGDLAIAGSQLASNGSVHVTRVDTNGHPVMSKYFGGSFRGDFLGIDTVAGNQVVAAGTASDVLGAFGLVVATANTGDQSDCGGGLQASVEADYPVSVQQGPGLDVPQQLLIGNPSSISGYAGRECTYCTSDTTKIPKADFTAAQNRRDVQFVNDSVSHSSLAWTFGDGTTSTLKSPLHQYATAGVYQACMSYSSPCGQERNAKCRDIRITGFQKLYPSTISQVGSYTIKIDGIGFKSLKSLMLVKNGQNPISPDSLLINSDQRMTAFFKLVSPAAIGGWTPLITFNNGDTSSILNGLTVAAFEKPKLTVTLAGSGVMRLGTDQIYKVTLANSGTVDAYLPLVFIGGAPAGSTFQVQDASVFGGKDISTISSLPINYDSVSKASLIDSVTQTSFTSFNRIRLMLRVRSLFQLSSTSRHPSGRHNNSLCKQ